MMHHRLNRWPWSISFSIHVNIHWALLHSWHMYAQLLRALRTTACLLICWLFKRIRNNQVRNSTRTLCVPESFGSTSNKSCHALKTPSILPVVVICLSHALIGKQVINDGVVWAASQRMPSGTRRGCDFNWGEDSSHCSRNHDAWVKR